MSRFTVLFVLLCATCRAALCFTDGLLPNGNFQVGPAPSQMKGTQVIGPNAIPDWELSGFVQYIKAGQSQGDMVLVVPDGAFGLRLGNAASISTKVAVVSGMSYSLTFGVARTCAENEFLNVSMWPSSVVAVAKNWGMIRIQTIYSVDGWDSYSWATLAESNEIEITILNPMINKVDAACGPILDLIGLKTLLPLQKTSANLLINGDFEEGPLILPNTACGVLIPPDIEDGHSPLPGWMVESLKVVKYIDSPHFAVPQGKFAVELMAGTESVIAQVVETVPGKLYDLTFDVGDANNSCVGPMEVKVFAANVTVHVPYPSHGEGKFIPANLSFKADLPRTRITFMSMFFTQRDDNSGALCGPVIDNVILLGVPA